jgi:hypothetical protein
MRYDVRRVKYAMLAAGACLFCISVVGSVAAQQPKGKPTIKAPGPAINKNSVPEARSERVIIDSISYKTVDGRIERRAFTDPYPEPLIGVNYLVEYPSRAIAAKLSGKVRFFATVKEGAVANVILQSDADELLLAAVRDAANKLKFDLSWHQPNKQEFQYTREVTFTLPDKISILP